MRRGAPRDVLYGLQQRAAEAPVALGVLRREEGDLQVAGPAPDGGGAHRLGVDQQLRQRVVRRPQLPADLLVRQLPSALEALRTVPEGEELARAARCGGSLWEMAHESGDDTQVRHSVTRHCFWGL